MARPQPKQRIRIGQPLCTDPDASLHAKFENYLDARRHVHGDKTRDDARAAMKFFLEFVVATGKAATMASFDVETLEAYKGHLAVREGRSGGRPLDGDTLSIASQSAYLRPLQTFGDYAEWAGWIEFDPFKVTYDSLVPSTSRGRNRRTPKLAEPADVWVLLDATAGDDPLALRDRAILLTGWWAGCREQDLCRVDVGDIDLRTGTLTFRDSKGRNDRTVILGGDALHAVARYLGTGRPAQVARVRPGRRGPISNALFLSDAAGGERNPGGRLTAGAVLQILTRRWNQAGREGSFGSHRLRHGMATLLSEANVSLKLIAEWLGQALVTTTTLYAHPTSRAILKQVEPFLSASLQPPDGWASA